MPQRPSSRPSPLTPKPPIGASGRKPPPPLIETDPLRSRAVQTITRLGEPEHRDLMRTFISSIFVGFKPTTANEHLGSLQKFLKLANLKYTERL